MGTRHTMFIMNHNYEIDWLMAWLATDRYNILGVSIYKYLRKISSYLLFLFNRMQSHLLKNLFASFPSSAGVGSLASLPFWSVTGRKIQAKFPPRLTIFSTTSGPYHFSFLPRELDSPRKNMKTASSLPKSEVFPYLSITFCLEQRDSLSPSKHSRKNVRVFYFEYLANFNLIFILRSGNVGLSNWASFSQRVTTTDVHVTG